MLSVPKLVRQSKLCQFWKELDLNNTFRRALIKLKHKLSGSGFIGHLDGYIDGQLQGWLCNTNSLSPVRIDVYLDGALLRPDVICHHDRADLIAAGMMRGNLGFQVPIDLRLTHGKARVQIRVAGKNTLLLDAVLAFPLLSSGSEDAIARGAPAVIAGLKVAQKSKSKRAQRYQVEIVRFSQTMIRGRAIDKRHRQSSFEMAFDVGGVWFRTVRGGGEFEVTLPIGLIGERTRRVGFTCPNGERHTIPVAFEIEPVHDLPVGVAMETDVSIIVPVYNALEDTETCIENLLAHTTLPARLILINDASTDVRIAPLLARYDDHPRVTVLTNQTNLGFTATVNRGIEAAGRDNVILLNSDARVTPQWLEGLRAAAGMDPKIGTVTPFSDRAGAFSAPMIGNENRLPFGVDEAAFSVAVRRYSLRLYPEVPTGNGFCLYVRRACIVDVGVFDVAAFPRGYGEENDFCMRARAAGWRNVIDDATYVFHERAKSFGEEKTELMVQGRAVVNTRFPSYTDDIKVFSASPVLDLARFRVRLAHNAFGVSTPDMPRALFVTATSSGGTPQTNRDLMAALGENYETWQLQCNSEVLTLSRVDKRGQATQREQHILQKRIEPITHLCAEYDRVVAGWLSRYGFELVHIRQLIWHSLNLPHLAKASGAAVVTSFHDFYTISPSLNLLDEAGAFCRFGCGPDQAYAHTDIWPKGSLPRLDAAFTAAWQKKFADALAPSDAFITTSPSARETLLQGLPDSYGDRFTVIPHGRDFPFMAQLARARDVAGPIRILVPGNISVSKGRALISQLLDRDDEERLSFHILGDHDFPAPRRGLHFHGRYKREDFADHVAQIGAHVGAVFSIWDETYCHTLTEMWAVGLPVIGLNFPTVAGRIQATGTGWVYDAADIDQLYAAILRDMDNPTEFAIRNAAVMAWQAGEGTASTTRAMAARYLDIYQNVTLQRLCFQRSDEVSSPEKMRIAVVCPAGSRLSEGPASTHIRVWERTHNAAERDLRFLRMTPLQLLAAVNTGDIDKALIQRNAIPAQIWPKLAAYVKQGRLKYAFEIDDDLLHVPQDKDPDGDYHHYASTLREIISQASVVLASSPALALRLKDQSTNISVVPNLLSKRRWRGDLPVRRDDGLVRGIYLGNASHDEDFALVKAAFDAAYKTNKSLRLRLVGVLHQSIDVRPEWLEIVEIPLQQRDYPAFVAMLRRQCTDLDFGIAPLAMTDFNSSKSHLKILDCAGLGLPVIASRHPVYADLADASHLTLVDNITEKWEAAIVSQVAIGQAKPQVRRDVLDWLIQNHMLEPSLAQFDAILMKNLGKANN